MAKQTIAAGKATQVAGLGLTASMPSTATPTNPTATVSTTQKMMGLAASVTPANASPQVLAIITGVAATATGAAAVTVGGRYGTGTAPANGATLAGTRFGASADPVLGPASAAAAGMPFTIAAVLTLAPGVPYWFDLAVATANASDAASVTAVGVTLAELA